MTLFFNLLPLLLAAIGLGLSWKFRKIWIAAATLAVLLVYYQAQPSYLPKGEISRSEVPVFTGSDATIENRLSKPMPGDERDQRRQEAVKQGLDFKQ